MQFHDYMKRHQTAYSRGIIDLNLNKALKKLHEQCICTQLLCSTSTGDIFSMKITKKIINKDLDSYLEQCDKSKTMF